MVESSTLALVDTPESKPRAKKVSKASQPAEFKVQNSGDADAMYALLQKQVQQLSYDISFLVCFCIPAFSIVHLTLHILFYDLLFTEATLR